MSPNGDITAEYVYVDFGTMSSYGDFVQVRTARQVGARIRGRRVELGWTQARLAEEAGVARQWVVAIEAGKATAELGAVLRTFGALGLVADVVVAPVVFGEVDLDVPDE